MNRDAGELGRGHRRRLSTPMLYVAAGLCGAGCAALPKPNASERWRDIRGDILHPLERASFACPEKDRDLGLILVIDTSCSTATTDASNLRRRVANALLSGLLAHNSDPAPGQVVHVLPILFDSQATVIDEAAPCRFYRRDQPPEMARVQTFLNTFTPSGLTNLDSGLGLALYCMARVSFSRFSVFILTDGYNTWGADTGLENTFREIKVPIHAAALPQSSAARVRRYATQTNGAHVVLRPHQDDLLLVTLQRHLQNALQPPQSLASYGRPLPTSVPLPFVDNLPLPREIELPAEGDAPLVRGAIPLGPVDEK